ncbi:MAG: LytR/AlgR family response regulator transcription factor [Bacteroidia bacterium]
MIKSIIVEDDITHSNKLKKLLKKIDDDVDIVSTCINIEQALIAIDDHKPDLVFLDIELEGQEKAAFELLKKIPKITFDVIFTTAHIDNNIKEIRMFGLCYVAKSYDENELEEALKKYKEKKKQNVGAKQITSLVDNIYYFNIEDQTMWMYEKGEYNPVTFRNILYCESNKDYTSFFFLDENNQIKKWISTDGIGEWEEFLEPFQFCRIHRETIINFKHLIKYINGEGGQIIVGPYKKHFDVSKAGKTRLLKLMKKL